jgi:hypothetical protein
MPGVMSWRMSAPRRKWSVAGTLLASRSRRCLEGPVYFGPDAESQSDPKVDEQKRTIFRTQERDWKTLDTYFGWPVTGSRDIRVV